MPSPPRLSPRASLAEQHEAYRILRSNLEVALLDLALPSVVLTSARAGEGKTSTCVNLALAMAAAGHRVVLADLDLRHPDAHRWLGVPNEKGLTDVVMQRCALRECLQFIRVGSNNGSHEGLYFLPTGTMVPNPAELLSEARTHALLGTLASQADIVLFDAPPVLPVADTLVIGRTVGGAVLVVEARKTPLAAVQQAKDALARSGTPLLGVVVSKLHRRDARSDHGYAYGYGYPHRPTLTRSHIRQDSGPGGAGVESGRIADLPDAEITSKERALGEELWSPQRTDSGASQQSSPIPSFPPEIPPTEATGPPPVADWAGTHEGSVSYGNGAPTDGAGIEHVRQSTDVQRSQ